MPIVIDTNAFHLVFNAEHSRHADFAPIKQWIDRGHGVLLFGGTTFLKELKECPYLRLVRLLKDESKALQISTAAVDTKTLEIRKLTKGTRCNDQHIMALLAAARCDLVCSDDKKSFHFLKNKQYFPKRTFSKNYKKIRIYSPSKKKILLTHLNGRKIFNIGE
jgi:hypothetical protein